MWIRSMNKKHLVDVNHMYSNDKFQIITTTNCFDNEEYIILGKYKSEERALEVLDMIQSRIIKGATFDYINNSKRITKEFVFQMPEE